MEQAGLVEGVPVCGWGWMSFGRSLAAQAARGSVLEPFAQPEVQLLLYGSHSEPGTEPFINVVFFFLLLFLSVASLPPLPACPRKTD